MGLPAPAAPNYTVYCNPAELAAARGGAALAPLPVVGAYPPLWLYKPTGGTDLYGTARATLLAVAGDTQTLTPAPAFVIKAAYEGVLAELVLSVTSPALGMLLRFSLLLNDGPVEGWTDLTPPETAAGLLQLPVSGPLQLTQGDRLTVQAVNVNGTGPFNVQVDLFGWQYPQALRRAIFGDAVGA